MIRVCADFMESKLLCLFMRHNPYFWHDGNGESCRGEGMESMNRETRSPARFPDFSPRSLTSFESSTSVKPSGTRSGASGKCVPKQEFGNEGDRGLEAGKESPWLIRILRISEIRRGREIVVFLFGQGGCLKGFGFREGGE